MLGLTEILHTLELGTDPKQMRKSLYGAYAWPAVATLGLSSSIYCDTKRGTKQLKDTQVGLTSFGALNIKNGPISDSLSIECLPIKFDSVF